MGMNQTSLFELSRQLAILTQLEEKGADEDSLLQAWHAFLQQLWEASRSLEQFEWGRSVRRNIAFALARVRDERRKREMSKVPRLHAPAIGYICDSLKCQLQLAEEEER